MIRTAARARSEKLSLPAASAGSGAFLIAGYWSRGEEVSVCVCVCVALAGADHEEKSRKRIGSSVLGERTYRRGSHAALLELLKGGSGSLGSFDEFELGLAAVGALGLRHCGDEALALSSHSHSRANECLCEGEDGKEKKLGSRDKSRERKK